MTASSDSDSPTGNSATGNSGTDDSGTDDSTTGNSATGTNSTPGYGCAAALAYLSTHAAPGFLFICPGYAGGHEAMTCDNYAPICPGVKEIVIADPCPVAYMNEASNSLVLENLSTAPIDPYGDSC